jgi:hypothetical protein
VFINFVNQALAVCKRGKGVSSDEAPSSSGLGYLVLIQKIAGSNPAGVTMKVPESCTRVFSWSFLLNGICEAGAGAKTLPGEACFDAKVRVLL